MLFDEASEDETAEAVATAGGVLVVGEKAATSEQLNEWELEYRMTGNRPPVTFVDFDESAAASAGQP